MGRQRLFLDTGAVVELSKLSHGRQRTLSAYVRSHYAYVMSPLTLLESLIRIARGNAAYFEQQRKPLRFIRLFSPEPKFLSFPGKHIASVLGGVRVAAAPGFDPRDFQRWLHAVTLAKNREELESGVRLPRRLFTIHALDLGTIEHDSQVGKQEHVERLEQARAGHISQSALREWATRMVAASCGTNMTQRFAVERLAAAYRYDCALFSLARSNSYDFAKHDSDWTDMNQLLYLADSQIVMVTSDTKLQKRIEGCGQEERVKHHVDLEREAGL